MEKKITDQEADEMINQDIYEDMCKCAVHQVPVYSLPSLLHFRNMEQLRAIAGMLHLRKFASLKKDALKERLEAEMVKPENMERLLLLPDKRQLDFFLQLLDGITPPLDRYRFALYSDLEQIGLVQSFFSDGKIIFAIADEIRAVCNDVLKNDFSIKRARTDLVREYALAAVNFYGAIYVPAFIDLFNQMENQPVNLFETYDIFSDHLVLNDGFFFSKTNIANDDLDQLSDEEISDLLYEANAHPRYIPAKEEFLKYVNPDYFPETSQIRALRKDLRKRLGDDGEVEFLLSAFHSLCIYAFTTEEMLELLDDSGVKFRNIDDANKLLRLMMDVHNSTRLWVNNGNTPDELFQEEKKYMRPLPDKPFKINRNDYCSCGSGKKFKNCCGKDAIEL
ncbi:MAG: SEC-C metal-binding domain-containing protein [Smithella sp.]